MINIGEPQFDYDSFKQLYDTNDSIQQLVKDFDKDSISLKTKNDDIDFARNDNASGDRISKTAASAAPKGLKDRHKMS